MTILTASSPVDQPAWRNMRRGVAVAVFMLHGAGLAVILRATPEPLPVASGDKTVMVSFIDEPDTRVVVPASPPAIPRTVAPVLATQPRAQQPDSVPPLAALPPARDLPMVQPEHAQASSQVAVDVEMPVAAAPSVVTPPGFSADYLRNPAPQYPLASRSLGETGNTLLHVLVSAEGKPLQIEIKSSSGSARLDRAALAAVRDWRFVPAREGDKNVAGWVDIPIKWNLGN